MLWLTKFQKKIAQLAEFVQKSVPLKRFQRVMTFIQLTLICALIVVPAQMCVRLRQYIRHDNQDNINFV